MKPLNREVAPLGAAFLEELIKRSVDAEEILRDCGRIRLQRAVAAAINLYLDEWFVGTQCPPGGQKEVR